MKTFSDFVLECSRLDESSLSRIKSKHDKGGVAVLSASRGDKSKKDNRERAKSLDRDVRSKFGKGATKVTGRYSEKDEKTGEEREVKQRSHVVTSGKKGKRKFKKEVKKLGKKYGQDAVLTQTKKTGTLTATRKGGLGTKPKTKTRDTNVKRAVVGKMRPGRSSSEGDTQIKKKTFTYEK